MKNRFTIKPTFRSSLSNRSRVAKINALALTGLLLLGTATTLLGPLYTANAAGYDYTHTDTIGTPVTLSNPYGFAFDGDGNYYVADSDGYYIKKFSPTGQLLLTFGSGNWSDAPEEFGWIEGIAVKSNGEIYLSDGDNLRIQVFSSTGQYVRTVGSGVFDNYNGKLTFDSADNLYVSDYDTVRVFNGSDTQTLSFGTTGTADGQFSGIGDLDVDTNGDIYVLDKSGARVSVFNAAGTFLRKFGSYTSSWTGPPEQFQYPNSLVIHSDGNLRIADRARVKTFSKTGTYLSLFGSDGYQSGAFNNLQHLEIASNGNIHTMESGADRIQTFTAAGTYLSQFGNEGSGPSQFFGPLGVATDSSDNIYVVDSVNNRMQKFNATGDFLLQWGGAGTGNGQFSRPRSVAVNSATSRVYVTEWSSSPSISRIQIFDLNGNYISQFGSRGTGDGQFESISRIDIASSGILYVADQSNSRIQVFSADGTFLRKWSTTGYPTGIAVDASENVYVVNSTTSYIYKFNSTGTLLATYGTATTGAADGKFSSPSDIAIDADGALYIADAGNHRVQIFNADGTFANKFGTLGDGINQLVYPQAVALDSSMRLIVADDDNHRIPIYSLGVPATAPSEPQGVTADTVTPNQAAITWTTPSTDGGSAVTSYTLEYKLTADSSWTSVDITAPTTSHTISSLPAGQYAVRVSASNGIGTSATSSPITVTVTNPVEPAPEPIPGSSPPANSTITPLPTNSTVTATDSESDTDATTATTDLTPEVSAVEQSDSGEVLVTWQPPEAGAPSSYVVEYRDASIPESNTSAPWKHAVTVPGGRHNATISLPTGDFLVRVAALMPGESSGRIILGVARVSIRTPLTTPATSTTDPTSATPDKGWPLWVSICIALLAIALFTFLPVIAWRRKKEQERLRRMHLPPRWQNPTL